MNDKINSLIAKIRSEADVYQSEEIHLLCDSLEREISLELEDAEERCPLCSCGRSEYDPYCSLCDDTGWVKRYR